MAKRKDTFVKVPLWWIEQATRATKSPQAFVCVWLLHLAWKAGNMTFPLPNARLTKQGADRRAKRVERGVEGCRRLRDSSRGR